jgi:hypothetical protein
MKVLPFLSTAKKKEDRWTTEVNVQDIPSFLFFLFSLLTSQLEASSFCSPPSFTSFNLDLYLLNIKH